MNQIKSREDANKYYKILNELVDNFIEKTKARPLEVYNYIKRNKNRFLEQNNLSDIKGVEIILSDIIQHRKSIQMDKIITFENYNSIFENIDDLKSNNTRKEKILADFFHISSGHIQVLNQDLNIYNIRDFDQKFKVVILSDYDISILKNNLKSLLTRRISQQNYNIDEISSEFLQNTNPIKFSDIINDEKLSNILDNLIDLNSCLKYFQFYLMNNITIDIDVKDLQLLGSENGYKIWKVIV